MTIGKAQLHAAVPTPLEEDLAVDVDRLRSHCESMLAAGCDGIALFGTTGEGPSFTVEERIATLDALLAGGLDPARLIVGTGCAALPDTVRLTRHAAAAGCAGQLIMPPFFFDQVTDDGVYETYARILEGSAETRPRAVLYHIPAVSGVPLRPRVVERLAATFPETVRAVKDSSGVWHDTAGLIGARGHLAVMVGHEPDISRAIAAGAAGTICGLANIVPSLMRRLCNAAPGDEATELQGAVTALASAIDQMPVIPALKAMTAAAAGDPAWERLRPPLAPLAAAQVDVLVAALHTARAA